MKARKFILMGFILCLPFASMAWGLLGHRIVGQIAETYLTKKARKAIKKILGSESVAMSSNWADFIKSDNSMSYLSAWHYLDFKGGLNEPQFMDEIARDTGVNAYTKINFLANELRNKDLEQEKKLMYLRLLIHIVGDVHQPLHVGHPEDQGGNGIKVKWFNDPYNLHQIWDEQLIGYQKLSYTEYAEWINHPSDDQKTLWRDQPVTTWLWESYQVAEKIYAGIKEPEQKLSYRYNYDYIGILNDQLLKGGIHLATLLNDIFK